MNAHRAIRRTALAAAGSVLVAVGLSVALVPALAPLGRGERPWRLAMLVGAALFALALGLWTWQHLQPLRTLAPADPARRRAAHDFPFRTARLCFATAVGAGLMTGLFLWRLGGAEAANAFGAGVITYLVLVLPVLAVYLATRQLLQQEAAGPPGAGPVPGIRQSVVLRLAFAVQLPLVVCMAGIVLVEQGSEQVYSQDINEFYERQYAVVLGRVTHVLHDPAARQATVAALKPPPGITPYAALDADAVGLVVEAEHPRPLSLRLPPVLVFATMTLLAALLGRWLAREATAELDAVRATLRALGSPDAEQVAAPPASRAVALRETADLVDAFRGAMTGFATRRATIARAAAARRQADQAKSRFLAHLSHELKSPLNTILGFTEVLLSGIDGPLTDAQREQLGIVWRSGDTLLRFILVLLDLARMEAVPTDGTANAAAAGFAPTRITGEGLARAVREQWRTDPLGAVRLDVTVAPGDLQATCRVDLLPTARALALAAGLTIDAMERGVVRLHLATEMNTLALHLDVAAAEGDDAERETLRDQLALDTGERPLSDEGRVGAANAVLALIRQVARAQGGDVQLSLERWPVLRVRFPLA